MKQLSSNHNWPLNLTLTVGVIVTLITALMMSQLDALQLRSAPALVELPVINTQGTAVASGSVIRLDAPVGAAVASAAGLDPSPTPSADGETPVVAPPLQANNAPSVVCGEVPAGWVLHTVQAGDTLNTLAIGTQTSVENLRAANCLQPSDEVSAGMQILVPQQVVVVACGPPQSWVRYQVQSGDTLGLLASRRNISAAEILTANCLTSSDLAPGKIIYLPPLPVPGAPPTARPSATATVPAATSTPQPTATSTNVPRPTSARPSPTIPGQPTTAPTVTVPPTTPPTATPPFLPTATAPRPSSTPRPTSEPSPTTVPATDTPEPPTSTPRPPTFTPPPPSTNTPIPPTNTPIPPTATVPPPTDTPEPPTATVPPPTATPEPPTAEPTATSAPEPTDEPPDPLSIYWQASRLHYRGATWR